MGRQQKKWLKLLCSLAFAAIALTGCTIGEDLKKEMTAKAERGDAESQFLLATMYMEANGVDQSDRKTVFWLKKAAEQDYSEAQRYLGGIYQYGVGTRVNYVEACKWYILAARKDNSNADVENKRLMEEMTPEQIELAKRLADAWRPKKF